MEGRKLILVLKITANQLIWSCEIKISSSLKLLSSPLSYMVVKPWGCNISRESWRKIEQIQKRFITYNLKIKSNTPYPMLLIEVGFHPIESMAMIMYLMYKHKINNMGNERLPKIALNSSQNQLRLKRCQCKDTMAWLNHSRC